MIESTMKPRDLVCIGRSGVDLYPCSYGILETVREFTRHVGGSPANTAVQAAKLGLDTAFLGKISQDGFGLFVRQDLERMGVDVSHLTVVDCPEIRQSLAVMAQPVQGEIESLFYRTMPADLCLTMEDINEEFLASFRMMLISGASLSQSPAREAVFHAMVLAKHHGVMIVFDPDYRQIGWKSLEECQLYQWLAIQQADVVCATKEEFAIATACSGADSLDAAVAILLNGGAKMVCVKDGANGSNLYLQDGTIVHGNPMPTQLLKPLGAGDSFLGAFLAGFRRGLQPQETLRYAASAASITISGRSCSDSMPTATELDSYLMAWKEDRLDQWFAQRRTRRSETQNPA